ncbi:phytoene/squalene synthase family protein [Streptomyces sp. MCL20-2]|uniref:phytoene/squalene synthase family protein n=1 Tax=Streptomyces sp. MCL20-2 TaxID=2967219 RepID=UPI00296692B2|nr:phytoene/squalene synthase family protein [Streptomyces sp. MCL20-2]
MTRRELDAAGIEEPALRAAYTHCRRLNARHGKTYFLATRLLPISRRPAVHALYGFARWADDIVDDLSSNATRAQRDTALHTLRDRLDTGLRTGRSEEPVVQALVHTAVRYDIDHSYFVDFMASMLSDLDVTDYPTYEHLARYMHGSAAVIGLQMLPVLGTVTPSEEAAPHAAALGVAFQLTNFLRDVGEDLDRGRVYLPADLLAAHRVDRELLLWSRRSGRDDPRIRAAVLDVVALTHDVYRQAEPGLDMLDPFTRPCMRTAFTLYRGILGAIEADGFQVVHRRSVVPRRRRAFVALAGAIRMATAQRAGGGHPGGLRDTAPAAPRGEPLLHQQSALRQEKDLPRLPPHP